MICDSFISRDNCGQIYPEDTSLLKSAVRAESAAARLEQQSEQFSVFLINANWLKKHHDLLGIIYLSKSISPFSLALSSGTPCGID